MASQIDVTIIDGSFPVAGKDNSSQGFRDNFTNIKKALTTASIEISNLQLYTPKLNETNDFGFSGGISRATIENSGFLANNVADTSGTIDYTLGNYHKSAITTNTTFIVSNWPSTGIYSSLRLEVAPTTSTSMTVNFGAGAGTLQKEISQNLPYTSVATSSTFWDLWTTDGGSTVFVKFAGGPFKAV